MILKMVELIRKVKLNLKKLPLKIGKQFQSKNVCWYVIEPDLLQNSMGFSLKLLFEK